MLRTTRLGAAGGELRNQNLTEPSMFSVGSIGLSFILRLRSLFSRAKVVSSTLALGQSIFH